MAKDIDPNAIEQAEFSTALRGYDRDEVDAYLRKIAAEHRRLLASSRPAKSTSEKPLQRFGQEVGDLLQQAKDVADRMKQRADEEAARLREETKRLAKEMKDKAKREAEQIKQAAEYEATARTEDAQRRLAELNGMEAKAKERLEELRARFRTVLEQLEGLTMGGSSEAQGAATAQTSAGSEAEQLPDATDRASEAEQEAAEEGVNGNNVVIRIDAESEEAPVPSKS